MFTVNRKDETKTMKLKNDGLKSVITLKLLMIEMKKSFSLEI